MPGDSVYDVCERFKVLGVEFQKSPNSGGMKGIAFVKAGATMLRCYSDQDCPGATKPMPAVARLVSPPKNKK